jgi:hypothetical protein
MQQSSTALQDGEGEQGNPSHRPPLEVLEVVVVDPLEVVVVDPLEVAVTDPLEVVLVAAPIPVVAAVVVVFAAPLPPAVPTISLPHAASPRAAITPIAARLNGRGLWSPHDLEWCMAPSSSIPRQDSAAGEGVGISC